ncbi:MAG: hypothetical protein AB9919_06940 [Geobacteraceae bacterium]
MNFFGCGPEGDDQPGHGRRDQAVGEYCNGKYLNECRQKLGEGFALACSTCPD